MNGPGMQKIRSSFNHSPWRIHGVEYVLQPSPPNPTHDQHCAGTVSEATSTPLQTPKRIEALRKFSTPSLLEPSCYCLANELETFHNMPAGRHPVQANRLACVGKPSTVCKREAPHSGHQVRGHRTSNCSPRLLGQFSSVGARDWRVHNHAHGGCRAVQPAFLPIRHQLVRPQNCHRHHRDLTLGCS